MCTRAGRLVANLFLAHWLAPEAFGVLAIANSLQIGLRMMSDVGIGPSIIRHQNGRVEWRSTNNVSAPFTIMAANISNDADGDGTIEPMFVPDSTTDPTRVTVQVTAEAPMPDPLSGEAIRYTVSSDVVLRKRLE